MQEQALVGLADDGGAAAVELALSEGGPPRLELLRLDREGTPAGERVRAPDAVARAVAARVLGEGARPEPLLEAAVTSAWPEALHTARDIWGLASPEPPRLVAAGSLGIAGAPPARTPLLLRLASAGDTRAQALYLAEAAGGPTPGPGEVLLARMPLVGEPVPPRLFVRGGAAWLLAGSVGRGEPLRRTVGLRAGDLRAGESELHARRGADALARGDLAAARRALDLAVAARPRSVVALYHAARLAAREGREGDALASLRAAAAVDLRRLQVLQRPDDGLAPLRARPEVREILGLRAGSEGAPPRPR